MSYIGVKINGLIQKMAGMPLMDVAFSNRSTNGLQNKIITAKKDEIEGRLDGIDNIITSASDTGGEHPLVFETDITGGAYTIDYSEHFCSLFFNAIIPCDTEGWKKIATLPITLVRHNIYDGVVMRNFADDVLLDLMITGNELYIYTTPAYNNWSVHHHIMFMY